ncbi:MAG TPA: anti-sigma factor [Armatimonadota bacterium]|jgi:anti-sigma factor RsiW
MSCKRYEVWLSLLMDGELGPDERDHLREHLDGCPACRSRARQYERLERVLGTWEAPEPAASLPSAFSARLQEEMASGPPPFHKRLRAALPRLGVARPVVAAGVSLLLLLSLAEVPGTGILSGPGEAPSPQTVSEAAQTVRNLAGEEIQDRLRHAGIVVQQCLQGPGAMSPSGPQPASTGAGLAPGLRAADEVKT